MIGYYLGGPREIPLQNAERLIDNDVKRAIEQNLRVNVEVRKDTVVISPREDTRPDALIKAVQIINAISIGFTKDDALELLSEDKYFDVIDLGDYVDKGKENQLTRIRALIIGEGGKAKRNIEELTGVKIVVKGRNVGIIGDFDSVRAARQAIEMLIRGRQHSTVYRWLQRWRRERREAGGPGYPQM